MRLYQISIHAPRTGSDRLAGAGIANFGAFQSTLPARGATRFLVPADGGLLFQSTLPARGATSILASVVPMCGFQSTLPARGATPHALVTQLIPPFQSTLPARGATSPSTTYTVRPSHFNPRSPHGERPDARTLGRRERPFQSTLPARGATHGTPRLTSAGRDFNPRSPHGERLRKVTILSIRIIGFAQKVYHKTVLLRISLAENAVILPEKPRNPVRTSLQKAGGLRFARAIRAARPYSISSPSGA